MGNTPVDMSGQKCGRLTVLARAPNVRNGNSAWHCKCDCGTLRVVRGAALRNGHTTSCGCARAIHNRTSRLEYASWRSMRARCEKPSDVAYARYGGRGIRVCARWSTFALFYADMGPRPSSRHTLDRVDTNGDYEPGNCRWATRTEQADNKRNSHMVTAFGETKTMSRWAHQFGLSPGTLDSRITRLGWSAERAMTAPLRHKKSDDETRSESRADAQKPPRCA